jgi:hypothetical protein
MKVEVVVASMFGPRPRSMHAVRGVNLPLPSRFPAAPTANNESENPPL